jgi:hypothetical protein
MFAEAICAGMGFIIGVVVCLFGNISSTRAKIIGVVLMIIALIALPVGVNAGLGRTSFPLIEFMFILFGASLAMVISGEIRSVFSKKNR